MNISRGLIRCKFLIIIISLIFIYYLSVQKAAGSSSVDYETPIYMIPISENIQLDVWKLCEKHHLSYELVLAVIHIEGVNSIKIDSIQVEIEKLAYFRDYWTGQGYADEIVFDLMLLSRERGIEGCKIIMKDNNSNYNDDYVQKVTKYKYYLEQIDSDGGNKSLKFRGIEI